MSNVREILEQIRSELRDHVQNGWKFTLDAEEGAVVLAALDAEGVGLRKAAKQLLDDLSDLIRESEGVASLHQNGDIATWEELLAGGRYEEWLGSYDDLGRALAALRAEENSND